MKIHRFYYFDEQNDDFAGTNIGGAPVPADYEYLPKSRCYRFFKPVVYAIVLFFAWLILKVFLRVPFVNKKVLRARDRKKGCFVYGNHTSYLPDAVSGAVSSFPHACYVVTNPDAVSIRGTGTLIRMLGAVPVPSALPSYRAFGAALKTWMEKGNVVTVYPEAHIWPKYSGIRPFPSVSFDYPVKLGVPCYAKTTVYVKKKNGKTRPKIVFDGPFYPDSALSPRAAREDLRDRVFAAMTKRKEEFCSSPDPRYIYRKVSAPEEVRSEITKE